MMGDIVGKSSPDCKRETATGEFFTSRSLF